MNYELKDKILITPEFLNELEIKSWQEIDYLQTQLANLADTPINDGLRNLFKNLLTSYYVFTGGIETLLGDYTPGVIETTKTAIDKSTIDKPIVDFTDELAMEETAQTAESKVSDPFEYFVDFDEPIGEPLTDDDLYNN